MTWLLADLGGTNCRCAISDGESITCVEEYVNRDFQALEDILVDYCNHAGHAVEGAALAVAGPVLGDTIRMSNMPWKFSGSGIAQALGVADILMLNDFEALAHALPSLGNDDLRPIGGGAAQEGGTLAVLGPGTGLGVAGLVMSTDGAWHAVSGEGGNVSLAASNTREAELIESARTRNGHCSAEDLISGPGLCLLHELMHGESGLTPEAIGQRIDAGNPQAVETIDQMFDLLGTVAGNVALTLGATGGVYVGGGIVPRYADRFAASGFRRRFEDRGKYSDYLQGIPTAIITRSLPALEGLRNVLKSRR
jgi:glucokinase